MNPTPAVTLRPMTGAGYAGMRTPALEESAADLARSAHARVDDAIRACAAHFCLERLAGIGLAHDVVIEQAHRGKVLGRAAVLATEEHR